MAENKYDADSWTAARAHAIKEFEHLYGEEETENWLIMQQVYFKLIAEALKRQ